MDSGSQLQLEDIDGGQHEALVRDYANRLDQVCGGVVVLVFL